ncbi:MAG TPA: hypothetical protein VGQ62_17830 [Chloroflexota bacterium]|jgi:hypothetical protein|nr:hypothetical protein [Chloroflexota bacterium]
MVAAAVSRVRSAAPASASTASNVARKARRSRGTYVIIGIPILLVLTFVWQVGSTMLHTEIAIRDAVAVSRVSLEADPLGSRIDMVLVDRTGQDTTTTGEVVIKLREPDGTVWQTTRRVTASDFVPVADGRFLAGRLGYSVSVPTTDWIRAPRRGGSATVSVNVQPTDGTAFSTVSEERFP